ncbi:hypothetical protein [Mucilaginibacter arboris]|uniref:Beta-carotene 15,15'-monooxygenase n=1 Tax=Mucilaginibacter arboris TaxID=2682090 RepID=A0A7K1SW54_9SPHI|nr:hypothetical protein [Mucilaginibacter arboris]MVN21555.1 hypothetical protein [Mucilaginibacter arboris]
MNLLYDNRFKMVALFSLFFLSAVIAAHFIIRSSVFQHNISILSNALSVDFIVTLPFCAWMLLVRKKIINFPLFLTIVSICYFTVIRLLPQQQNLLLQSVKYLLAATELISVVWLFIKIKKIRRFYRRLSSSDFDFPEKLQQSLESVLGQNKIADILAAEFVMIRYGLFFWYKRKKEPYQPNEFSIYKNTSFAAFTGVLLFMLILETGLVHLLLLHFGHENIALGLLISEIYTVLFIIAYITSVKQRRIVIANNEIKIRIGLLYTAQIKAAQIENISPVNASFIPEKAVLNLAKPIFDQPNLFLKLNEPVAFSAAFGIRKYVSQITLHVDCKEDFLESVKMLVAHNS